MLIDLEDVEQMRQEILNEDKLICSFRPYGIFAMTYFLANVKRRLSLQMRLNKIADEHNLTMVEIRRIATLCRFLEEAGRRESNDRAAAKCMDTYDDDDDWDC